MTKPPRMHAFFGEEVRHARDALGLTAADLAAKTFYSRSQITMIETGRRLGVRKEPITRIDDALAQDGRIVRLWVEARKAEAPANISDLIEYEAQARAIRQYHPVLVPGLLQTEDYMRAVFIAVTLAVEAAPEIDEMVRYRLSRQEIFDGDSPLRYAAIIDESVITRIIGAKEVMIGQLKRIRELMDRRGVTIQVMPHTAGTYPVPGPLMILDVDGGSVVHLESALSGGQTTTDRDTVEMAIEMFDLLRAQALSIADSIRIIEQRIEDLQS